MKIKCQVIQSLNPYIHLSHKTHKTIKHFAHWQCRPWEKKKNVTSLLGHSV